MPATADRSRLVVRVTPNAPRSTFAGWSTDEKGLPVLLVKLQAPPVEGKANKELTRFLSEALSCAKNEITLLRGDTSRQKTLEIPARVVPSLPPP